jgi:chromosome segregation ATPase
MPLPLFSFSRCRTPRETKANFYSGEVRIDEQRLLIAYRKVRDSLLIERDQAEVSADRVSTLERNLRLCAQVGSERMEKLNEVRDKQDETIIKWKILEKEAKRKKAELGKDVSELKREAREISHALDYEQSQLKDEEKATDKFEDDMYVKDNEIRILVRELGMASQESQSLAKLSDGLRRALTTTTRIANSGEDELENVTKRLGNVEIKLHGQQRDLKIADEESRMWRHRYQMVEKDLWRAETLLDTLVSGQGTKKGKESNRNPKNGYYNRAAASNNTSSTTTGYSDGTSSALMNAVMDGSNKGEQGDTFFGRQMAEGMHIDRHDTFNDIAGRHNRRQTANARSRVQHPELWLPEEL